MHIRTLVLPALLALGLGAAPVLAQTPPAPAPDAPTSDAPAPPAAAPEAAPEATTDAPDFAIPQAGGDTAQQVELITGLCGVQMKSMSPLACACLADRALVDLSAPQRDYLIATAVSPPVADRMLGDGRVGPADQTVIFAFLNETADACASGTYREPGAAPAAGPEATPTPAPPAGDAAPEGAGEPAN